MKGTSVFGRFSQVRVLLAGLVVATLAAVLAVAFADAKPAEAEGEIWYGTVELRGTGTHTYKSGMSVTNNSVLRIEAPTNANTEATLFAKLDITENYPDPYPGDNGSCYLSQHKTYGTVKGPGYISVNGPYAEDGNRYWLDFGPRPALEDEFDNRSYSKTVYSECDGQTTFTEPNGDNGELRGSIYSGQNAATYFRAGQLTDPPDDQAAYANPKSCSQVHSPGQECASFGYPDGAIAQWSLAANPCSGYSQSFNLGNNDTLFVFNPCQTDSLSSRLSFFDDVTGAPDVCNYAFAKRVSQACSAYKTIVRTQWAQNRWFMYHSAIDGATCGLWVVDDASWRPPKVRPATNYDTGSDISGVNRGRTVNVKSAYNPAGYQPVTC